MVRIRLKRMGRRHRPYYRVCVVDIREERDGRTVEDIGTYDPQEPEVNKRTVLKAERARYWLGVGAQPSESAAALLRQVGIQLPKKTKKTAARTAKKKAKAAGAAK
jgi:small subunit ribosomal protein S16